MPTTAEAGVPALEVEVLYIAWVPAATPETAQAVLAKAIADALALPEVRAQLQRLDLVPEAQTGDAAARRIAAQADRYARTIKATGLKIE